MRHKTEGGHCKNGRMNYYAISHTILLMSAIYDAVLDVLEHRGYLTGYAWLASRAFHTVGSTLQIFCMVLAMGGVALLALLARKIRIDFVEQIPCWFISI